jgi:hypothetical protein
MLPEMVVFDPAEKIVDPETDAPALAAVILPDTLLLFANTTVPPLKILEVTVELPLDCTSL